MVMGANVQVCWEKFCRYWDVEMRLVPMEGDRYHLTAEEAVKYCDENTIGVVPVLGSTFDGSYEPVADICAALDKLQADTGLDVPVHVDGASGGFIAPFLDPDLVWDFRLPRVQSINASGHKYGLVYPGVGWVDLAQPRRAARRPRVQRELPRRRHADVRAELLAARATRSSAQYYNFLRLGFDGLPPRAAGVARRRDAHRGPSRRRWTSSSCITDGSELPVFAFAVADGIDNYTVFDVSRVLRERGWLVPAYTFPENREDLAALRIVVRNGFARDLADLLDHRHLRRGRLPLAAPGADAARPGAAQLPPLARRRSPRPGSLMYTASAVEGRGSQPHQRACKTPGRDRGRLEAFSDAVIAVADHDHGARAAAAGRRHVQRPEAARRRTCSSTC